MTNCAEEISRGTLTLLSVILSAAVFWVLEPLQAPARRLLHVWYVGGVSVFLVGFLLAMLVLLRGRVQHSYWPILIGGLLGWGMSAVAYVMYFRIFGFDRFGGALLSISYIQHLQILFAVTPAVTFSWLFGMVAGLWFVLLRRAFKVRR